MDNHQRFQAFYGNNKHTDTCHGSGRMGDGYVCPSPTIGGTGPKLIKHNTACGKPVPNMSNLSHCPQTQVGGGMMFTATGQLINKKQNCGCQKGGKGKKPTSPTSPMFNDMLDPNYSGDSSVLDYPRNTHKCSSSYDNYDNGRGTPVNGYYYDVVGNPVGNRPEYGTHDNIKPNNLTARKGNLLDRKFDCQQPFWCEKCI